MIGPEARPRVLCLSGGGFRGLFTASLLANLEKDLGVLDFRNHFDLFIGTSTGALIAAALAVGKSGHEIQSLFMQEGPKIFPRNSMSGITGDFSHLSYKLWRTIKRRHLYDRDPLKALAQKILGDIAERPIGEVAVPLATVAVSKITRRHHVFSGSRFSRYRDREVKVIDAILASAAAPYYFKPYQARFVKDPELRSDVLLDGGLVANAPALLGASLAKRAFGVNLQDVSVLHLDTAGVYSRGAFDRKGLAATWPFSTIFSGLDLVDLAMGAQESLQISLASELLGAGYVYLSAHSSNHAQRAAYGLDDASKPTQEGLIALASETWDYWHLDPRLGVFFPPSPPRFISSPQVELVNHQSG